MNFNDAWEKIISICPNEPDFYIELSYRRIRSGNKTITECVIIDDYSDKEITAPTFQICIDKYMSVMEIPIKSDDIVEEEA